MVDCLRVRRGPNEARLRLDALVVKPLVVKLLVVVKSLLVVVKVRQRLYLYERGA